MSTPAENESKAAYEGSITEQQQRQVSAKEPHEVQSDDTQDALSRVESQLPPPPDGGLHAWLKVLGGFLIYINIWSVLMSASALTKSHPNYE